MGITTYTEERLHDFWGGIMTRKGSDRLFSETYTSNGFEKGY
jgi:hypothetical protein